MTDFPSLTSIILSLVLLFSALGVIFARKPVYAGLSFLLALLTLSAIYVQLGAEFVAIVQILVYAGAILVIFMFVIVLFQDAYMQIEKTKSCNSKAFLWIGALLLCVALGLMYNKVAYFLPADTSLPIQFGFVETLAPVLFVDFCFPFEAVTLLFLIAVVGAVYIAKKEELAGG